MLQRCKVELQSIGVLRLRVKAWLDPAPFRCRHPKPNNRPHFSSLKLFFLCHLLRLRIELFFRRWMVFFFLITSFFPFFLNFAALCYFRHGSSQFPLFFCYVSPAMQADVNPQVVISSFVSPILHSQLSVHTYSAARLACTSFNFPSPLSFTLFSAADLACLPFACLSLSRSV